MNYPRIREEIDRFCTQIGRDPGEVTLIAVSKTVSVAEVERAIDTGCHQFGENRPDSLAEKHAACPRETWHFIGNIQSRKIGEIVECAQLVHSLCKFDHVAKIDRAAAARGKVQDVLIEANMSGEASKSGLAVDDLRRMVELCLGYSHIRVRGLMTMAPQGDRATARACFDSLYAEREKLRNAFPVAGNTAFMHELSMGMSEDWREGVAAGATIVRIGRAIFDEGFFVDEG